MNALDFCLDLHRARARLQRKLDEDLGFFHGIGWDDFVLLSQLDAKPGGLAVIELAKALGVSASAALRRLPPLEKTGLVERERSTGAMRVTLRPGGARVVREARETAGAICDHALWGEAELPALATALDRLASSPALRVA